MKPLRHFASILFAAAGTAALAQTPPPAPPSPADAKLQYANGIVAIAEDRIITVADVMRRVGPLMEQARAQAKDQKEFEEIVARLQDEKIQQLIDEVLMVKEFRKDEKRHIPASYVDNAIADEKAERFDNDQSKYLAYLKSQGKTKREYRRDKEEEIITSYMQSQQRRSQSIVSPVRIETFYKENKSEFYRDDEVRVRMISLPRRRNRRVAEGESRQDTGALQSRGEIRGLGAGIQHRGEPRKRRRYRLAATPGRRG
jgi:peptidyl-prolyl cis-trans isomerase SurA